MMRSRSAGLLGHTLLGVTNQDAWRHTGQVRTACRVRSRRAVRCRDLQRDFACKRSALTGSRQMGTLYLVRLLPFAELAEVNMQCLAGQAKPMAHDGHQGLKGHMSREIRTVRHITGLRTICTPFGAMRKLTPQEPQFALIRKGPALRFKRWDRSSSSYLFVAHPVRHVTSHFQSCPTDQLRLPPTSWIGVCWPAGHDKIWLSLSRPVPPPVWENHLEMHSRQSRPADLDSTSFPCRSALPST